MFICVDMEKEHGTVHASKYGAKQIKRRKKNLHLDKSYDRREASIDQRAGQSHMKGVCVGGGTGLQLFYSKVGYENESLLTFRHLSQYKIQMKSLCL